jgi:hypothetical protein
MDKLKLIHRSFYDDIKCIFKPKNGTNCKPIHVITLRAVFKTMMISNFLYGHLSYINALSIIIKGYIVLYSPADIDANLWG